MFDQNQFSIAARSDDVNIQVTFTGSPLYMFSNDALERGSVIGQAGGLNANFVVMEAL